ncbi:glucose PTS transporter subunit EIIB, partial [Streptococcus suis]
IWVTVLFGVIMYFISNFMIKKFNLATSGRNGNYDDSDVTTDTATAGVDVPVNSQVVTIINLLGGKGNIADVDACMTRLRVTVNDVEKVGSEDAWKRAGAMGLIIKGSGVQAVYGPKADVLKSDIQDLLDSGVDIPTIDLEKVEDKSPEASQFKGVKDTVV